MRPYNSQLLFGRSVLLIPFLAGLLLLLSFTSSSSRAEQAQQSQLVTGGSAPAASASGLIGELRLEAPLMTEVNQGGLPIPPPLRPITELRKIESVWWTSWLPVDIQGEPKFTLETTATGERVLRTQFQVYRNGYVLPAMVLQLTSSSDGALSYTPQSIPLECDYGLASEIARQPLECGNAQQRNGIPDIGGESGNLRDERVSISMGGHPGEQIVVRRSNQPTLFGILWRVEKDHLYVGGYLPLDELRRIAEGLVYAGTSR